MKHWLKQIFSRRRLSADLSEEMQQHLDEKIEALIASGMPREEAIHAAHRAFGNATLIEQRSREVWMWPLIESIWADIKFALRQLRKSPGFTAAVVLTLALGIGANTAIFSLVNAVLLRSLPVRNPDELVVMRWSARDWPNNVDSRNYGDCASDRTIGMHSNCALSYSMFKEIAGRKDLFSSAMAFAGPQQIDLSGNGPASIAQGVLVSGNYFETLGVRAALGRTLQPEDEQPGAPAVAVLDYGYWQRAFGGATTVVGRTLRLNNIVFTIVGVADRDFTRLTPGQNVDFWVPLWQATPLGVPWAHVHTSDTSSWWLTVVGRLQPGVSIARVQATMNVWFLNQTMRGEKPRWKMTDDPRLTVLPAQSGLTGFRDQFGEPLILLLAAVGIVLVIACANVAGLMLARGAEREKEMAVRIAVGAGKRRVIRQLLTESLLLSFMGAALGTLVAYMGATGLAAFFSKNSNQPMQIDLHPNAPVLLFAIGVAVLTGIGFGLAPAFRGAQADVAMELKGASATTRHGSRRRFSLGSGLVVLQVALSVVMLSGAGLLLRTLDKLHSVDPGFDTGNLLLFSVEPELAGYKEQRIPELYANLQRRLAALPGVVSVSYSSQALLAGSIWEEGVQVEGRDKDGAETQILPVGPDYFATMKIPLVAGRLIRREDLSGKPLVGIVNQAFVRKFVGGRNPIGLRVRGGNDQQWAIVGVVRDTKYQNLRSADAPTAYVPLMKDGATFVLRTAAQPAVFMPAVRQIVHQADNNLPVIRMRTQTEIVDRTLFNERLVARLFGLFGLLGLALACIGVYGLLSYEVARRTREIGIRSALGAQRFDLLLLVMRQGLLLLLCGVTAGIAAAIGVTRLLASLLYGVRPTDAVTFCGVAATLIVVGLIACFIPARRAASIDPMIALRAE
ncbi:MAG TPA: ABC transporter permease [Acidobacteriaceae bacterium]|nr:ABC transporter permease [Acidobacteriaceae bacterium]